MKTVLFFLSCLVFVTQTQAEILLVPARNSNFEDYQKICEKNNYLCFPQAFKAITNNETPLLNGLMLEFDLDNTSYVKAFNNKAQRTIKEENLSLEQMKSLDLALTKIAEANPKDLKNHELLNKIESYINAVDALPEMTSGYDFILASGKLIENNAKNQKLLQPFNKDFKFTFVDFMSYSKSFEDKQFFLSGDCHHPIYNSLIQNANVMQVMPFFPEGCTLTEKYEWGSDLIADHFRENKNKYLWGAAAIVTAAFLKNYTVSMSR